MVDRKFRDIGYNFLVIPSKMFLSIPIAFETDRFQIGGDGSIFEGRGWGIHGAHVPKYNSRSIGICLLGNFMGKQILYFIDSTVK